MSNNTYNPNNCSTCDYKRIAHTGDGRCYMFRNEPSEVCMVHTGRRMSVTVIIELLRRERA